MASNKHAMLFAILAPFFGLPALAAPRPQTSTLPVSLVPVSTVSSMAYVPVVTSMATSAVIVTADVPTETVYPTTLTDEPLTYFTDDLPTPFMTISPIGATSTAFATYTSFTHSTPTAVSTIATTVFAASNPLATVGPWIDVNTGNETVKIGDTCKPKHKSKGRDKEIENCIVAKEPKNICAAFDYACDCYQLQESVKCYKPQYHECKKDGYYAPLVMAQEQACLLKTLRAQTYTELSTSTKVFTRTH